MLFVCNFVGVTIVKSQFSSSPLIYFCTEHDSATRTSRPQLCIQLAAPHNYTSHRLLSPYLVPTQPSTRLSASFRCSFFATRCSTICPPGVPAKASNSSSNTARSLPLARRGSRATGWTPSRSCSHSVPQPRRTRLFGLIYLPQWRKHSLNNQLRSTCTCGVISRGGR